MEKYWYGHTVYCTPIRIGSMHNKALQATDKCDTLPVEQAEVYWDCFACKSIGVARRLDTWSSTYLHTAPIAITK